MPRDALMNMGNNGKKYYDIHFSKEHRIEQLDRLFLNEITAVVKTSPRYEFIDKVKGQIFFTE